MLDKIISLENLIITVVGNGAEIEKQENADYVLQFQKLIIHLTFVLFIRLQGFHLGDDGATALLKALDKKTNLSVR